MPNRQPRHRVPTLARTRKSRQGKPFLFEKKNQKTFAPLRDLSPGPMILATSKSFLVLFFKKNGFLILIYRPA
jgi:hypothetical protein